jgi:hypothetical protein
MTLTSARVAVAELTSLAMTYALRWWCPACEVGLFGSVWIYFMILRLNALLLQADLELDLLQVEGDVACP